MAKTWVADRHKKLAMSVIPKVGSTSIKTSVPNQVWRSNAEVVNQFSDRVAWIRHPIRRVESMYKFLKDQHESGASTLSHIPTGDYKLFIDFVLENENQHWKPQVEILTESGIWVPTVAHKFEDIGTLWSNYYDWDLECKNGSSDHPVLYNYRRKELNDVFKADLDLWESL